MRKIVARHWAAGGEYTIKCLKCRDTGYVRCFSAKAMRDAVECVRGRRALQDVRVSFCDVPCSCDAGDEASFQTLRLMRWKMEASSDWTPMRADDERAIVADPMRRTCDLVESLIGWARDYQQRLDELAAAREAPYRIFEEFNAGVD